MSEITINNLPAEVIINILRRLDQDTLKNAALTCNLWKQLTESFCSWSVVLYNHQSNAEWREFVSTTERTIEALKIYGFAKKQNPNVMDIFKKHGYNIRKLTLIYGHLDSVSDVAVMFEQLPNLEQLSLSRVQCKNKNSPLKGNVFPTLAKLKTLDCVETECSILECFERSKITTLKFRNVIQEINKVRLSNLLKKQTNLKTLDIGYIDLLYLVGDMPFQLSKLCLRGTAFTGDFNHVTSFLKCHAQTLQELELGKRSPQYIYEFLFSNLDNLKSLQFYINDMPNNVEFYQRLKINRSISHLTLMDSPPQKDLQDRWSTSLKIMCTRLPNLTNVCFLTFSPSVVLPFIPKELENKVDVECFNGC